MDKATGYNGYFLIKNDGKWQENADHDDIFQEFIFE